MSKRKKTAPRDVIAGCVIIGFFSIIIVSKTIYNGYRSLRYCKRCLGRGVYVDPDAPVDPAGSREDIYKQRLRPCPDCNYKVPYSPPFF